MSDRILALVCSISGGELEAPTNLVTSEVTHQSFRATWTAPSGPVDKFRVVYMSVASPTQEVRCYPPSVSAVLVLLLHFKNQQSCKLQIRPIRRTLLWYNSTRAQLLQGINQLTENELHFLPQ